MESASENLSDLAAFVGYIALIIFAAAGGAWGLFLFWGRRWIENQFSQRLEALRQENAIELHRLQAIIDSMLSGNLKIREKEFETIPEAWIRLLDARNHVIGLTSTTRTKPILNDKDNDWIDWYLGAYAPELNTWEREEIKTAEIDKGDTYLEIMFWHDLHETKNYCREFHNFIEKYGIFFPVEIRDLFKKASDAMWDALFEKELGKRTADYTSAQKTWKKVKEDIEPLCAEIETHIFEYLRSHGRDTEHLKSASAE